MADRTVIKVGAALKKSVLYGSLLNVGNLSDPTLAAFVASQNRIVVAESEMKMRSLQPTQGTFSFTDADAIAAFAQTNGIALRFHTLVWHGGLPTWAASAIAADWQGVMDSHIAGVSGRYAVQSMDVANEVIADDGSGWRTDSPWYQAAGSIDYVRRAFAKARLAAPAGTKLMLCDYGCEAGATALAKSTKLMELASTLKSDGTIDGLSLQCHINLLAAGASFNQTNFAAFLAQAKSMGLEVNLTEIDCANQNPNYDEATFKQVSADVLSLIVQTWASAGVGQECLTWCIKQDLSWLHDTFPTRTQWPGCFDASYRRNPLFYRLRGALN